MSNKVGTGIELQPEVKASAPPPVEVIVITQVQSKSFPSVHELQKNPWSSEVCDICADGKICCCVACCGLFYSCYLSSKLGENTLLPCVAGNLPLRLKVRYLLSIRGSICSDFCNLLICGPCAICQTAREMKTAGWID